LANHTCGRQEDGDWIVPRPWESRLQKIALLLCRECGGVEEVYMEVMCAVTLVWYMCAVKLHWAWVALE
jgi:hypothetical protein